LKTITYVSKKSLANIFGIFGLFSGLFMGLMTAFIGNVGGAMIGFVSTTFSAISIIVMPIFYSGIGYISGYVFASIYNKVIVPKLGGIEIELR
jgi:hypothetical protein